MDMGDFGVWRYIRYDISTGNRASHNGRDPTMRVSLFVNSSRAN